jgi:hypothetical protein
MCTLCIAKSSFDSYLIKKKGNLIAYIYSLIALASDFFLCQESDE